MIVTEEILYIFIAIMAICIMGFKKYIWFISIGYGASISITGIMLLLLFSDNITTSLIIASTILILYGIRLSGYLIYREIKTSYNKKMKGEVSDGSHMPFFAKVMLWITCSLLYITMTSPVIYRFLNNNYEMDNVFVAGMTITVIGILFEAISDLQKNAAKKKNPNRFCDTGLFKIVRCPNYLGELIIWTGVFISGINVLNGIGQWIIALIGYLGIIYIMFSGARRLEIRQDKNYGEDREYKKYKKSTPILLPFVPIYSVKKHKWLVG